MPALSIATSVPVPMAMPTSAAASAGASLTPSPAIATTRPSRAQPLDHARSCCRAAPRPRPRRCRACARPPRAVVRLSPVSMTTRMPSPRSACERRRRRRLDRIGDGDDARELAVDRDEDRGRAVARAAARPRRRARAVAMPSSARNARVAERDAPALDHADRALAGRRVEARARGASAMLALRRGRDDRARRADARSPLDAGGEAQHFVLVEALAPARSRRPSACLRSACRSCRPPACRPSPCARAPRRS